MHEIKCANNFLLRNCEELTNSISFRALNKGEYLMIILGISFVNSTITHMSQGIG